MTGFEPGSSGIGSNRAINCARTTARSCHSTIESGLEVVPLFATNGPMANFYFLLFAN